VNRIALVEDHERIAGLVCKALSGAGIEADVFGRFEHAWQGLALMPYAAVIIDRGLPDGDGLELLRRLRQKGVVTPCLILTARDAIHDRIAGLEAGADDYLPKPFSMEELVARVRALMRRPPQLQSLTPAFGGIEIAPQDGALRHGAESVSLAPAELQVMLCLVRAAGQTVRRTMLEGAGWGLGEAVTPNALDVALHRLRRKLLAIDAPVRIVNVRGHGYALQAGGGDEDRGDAHG
jgi:DNA-binding response OmpR family regulator